MAKLGGRSCVLITVPKINLSTLTRSNPQAAADAEPASTDIHVVSYVDAREPTVSPFALHNIKQFEQIKAVAGNHFNATVQIEKDLSPRAPQWKEGRAQAMRLLAPLGAGIAGAVINTLYPGAIGHVIGSSLPLSIGAVTAGIVGTVYLARADNGDRLGRCLSNLSSAAFSKWFGEADWKGRRTYEIAANGGKQIGSPYQHEGLPQTVSMPHLTNFLTTNMTKYPAAISVVHMLGHGCTYRYAAGLPTWAYQQALEAAGAGGRKPDLLLLESCLEGNLEALAATSQHARYAVVSEESMPVGSLGESLKAAVVANLGKPITPCQLGTAIVRHGGPEGKNFWTHGGLMTLALVNMQKVPQLTAAVDRLGALLADEVKDGRLQVLQAVKATPSYPKEFLLRQLHDKIETTGDLGAFVDRVSDIYTGRSIKAGIRFSAWPIKIRKSFRDRSLAKSPRAAQIYAACKAVREQIGQTVVAYHAAKKYRDGSGLSVQLPGARLAAAEVEFHDARFADSAAPPSWKRFVMAASERMAQSQVQA